VGLIQSAFKSKEPSQYIADYAKIFLNIKSIQASISNYLCIELIGMGERCTTSWGNMAVDSRKVQACGNIDPSHPISLTPNIMCRHDLDFYQRLSTAVLKEVWVEIT
jgi:hypothetical protein